MDRNTKGAWIVHHGRKLASSVNGATEYGAIDIAAKSALLLARMAESKEAQLSPELVKTLAKVGGLNPRTELNACLNELENQKAIDRSASGDIAVLGITARTALAHAADIFDRSEPERHEEAAIGLARCLRAAHRATVDPRRGHPDEEDAVLRRDDRRAIRELDRPLDDARRARDEVRLIEHGLLAPDEAAMFLEEMGLHEAGLDRLIRAGYELLGLQTYFTVGPKEARAWTITKGTLAPQAAGVIHGDFERGFIRSETIAYDDYVAGNGEAGAREAGKFRVEGKTYEVKDGDVLHFLFNA